MARRSSASVVAGSMAVRIDVAQVSRDFFDVLATSPFKGRRFLPEELHEGGPGVAIVSERFWRQHLNRVGDLSAASVRVNGQSHLVVGVMPQGFTFPANVDIWTPREHYARNPFRTGQQWQAIARVKDDLRVEAARAEATALARRASRTWCRGHRRTCSRGGPAVVGRRCLTGRRRHAR